MNIFKDRKDYPQIYIEEEEEEEEEEEWLPS
jgi:hypothetical protein